MQENLLPVKIYLKLGVESFIFNGADLMWPGIWKTNKDEFRQNALAIIFAVNQNKKVEDEQSQGVQFIPVATGRMLTNKVPASRKGKAVEPMHYLFDELWNSGDKKMPQEVVMKEPEVVPEDGDGELEGKTQDMTLEEGKEEEKEEEKVVELTQEEWDQRVVEAFKRACWESVEDYDLPLEPSDF